MHIPVSYMMQQRVASTAQNLLKLGEDRGLPGILVQDLLKIGAARIYSEYWTRNRLTFHSREQIICSVPSTAMPIRKARSMT